MISTRIVAADVVRFPAEVGVVERRRGARLLRLLRILRMKMLIVFVVVVDAVEFLETQHDPLCASAGAADAAAAAPPLADRLGNRCARARTSQVTPGDDRTKVAVVGEVDEEVDRRVEHLERVADVY